MRRHTRHLAIAAIFAASAPLAACVSETAPDFRSSPYFPIGYSDGCASATEESKSFSTTSIRDEAMFKDDAGYRSGWRQGHAACSPEDTNLDQQNLYK